MSFVPIYNSFCYYHHYHEKALELGNYHMLEIAITFMPPKKRISSKSTGKYSPSLSSLEEKLNLMKERVAQLKNTKE